MRPSRRNIPFAFQRDNHPWSARLVNLLLYLRVEANGTHDTITKLLVENGLVGISVVLDNLVESVNERLHGGHRASSASVWEAHQLRRKNLFGNSEELGKLLDILGGSCGLSIEDSSYRDLGSAQLLSDGLEAKTGLGLCSEQSLRVGRQTVYNGALNLQS